MADDIKQDDPKYAGFYKANEVFYTFDPVTGKYGQEQHPHPEENRPFIIQSWLTYDDRIEEARQKYHNGEASPILYHMERMTLEVPALAQITKLAKWRVKRHFKPANYKKLSRKFLEKYAIAFRIPVEDFEKID